MPKPLKKKSTKQPRRPTDLNQLARQLVAESTKEPEPLNFKAQLSEYMSKLGAKGGKVSGAKRLTNLTDEQRQEIAARGGRARWARAKAKQERTGGDGSKV
jgi:general stress protein YciG